MNLTLGLQAVKLISPNIVLRLIIWQGNQHPLWIAQAPFL
jgi:hypothetical protein